MKPPRRRPLGWRNECVTNEPQRTSGWTSGCGLPPSNTPTPFLFRLVTGRRCREGLNFQTKSREVLYGGVDGEEDQFFINILHFHLDDNAPCLSPKALHSH